MRFARFAASLLVALATAVLGDRSFRIQDDSFVKDGEVFPLRSGSLHYFRVPPEYWRDRMQRMKALGLNCVTTVVPWNYHEEVEGQVHGLDLITGFLDAAQEENMLVFFRPGPYTCGEWEFGGFPAWLLYNDRKGIKLRTYEQTYIAAVDKWLNTLYGAVAHYKYSNGGPIALLQIENEYGSFGNCNRNPDDAKYMNYLLDLATSYFGTDIVYTTIDGGEGRQAAALENGSPFKGDPRVLGTVDGALGDESVYKVAFEREKEFNAPGHAPKMWSELWTGWFTSWQDATAANKSYDDFYKGVKAMVDLNASVSIYMAHGGTNFGFWSGANGDSGSKYRPDITSYDYNAPISEAGDHNIGMDGGDLFQAVQSAIATKDGKPSFSEPPAILKVEYGSIKLSHSAGMFDGLDVLTSCSRQVAEGSALPSFEDLRHNYGLVLYEHEGEFDARAINFTGEDTRDRIQVFVDDVEAATAYRADCPKLVSVPAGSGMKLLVENMGRINYGHAMYDYKGYLSSQPPVAGKWTAKCLPLAPEQVQGLDFKERGENLLGPVFQRGTLHIQGEPHDTWLDMLGFTKGYVWVNGKNLGRFWETAGPQHTLYLPAPFLLEGDNEVIVLDLHHTHATSPSTLKSVAEPRYSQPTASSDKPVYV